jgi:hypothetical protein
MNILHVALHSLRIPRTVTSFQPCSFPPAGWYVTATLTISGEYTTELLAHLRNTGRILDGFRFAMNGSKTLSTNLEFEQLGRFETEFEKKIQESKQGPKWG